MARPSRFAPRSPPPTHRDHDRQALVVSHNKIGDAHSGAGRREEALAAHRRALKIEQQLAASNPSNVEWQRGLWFTHLRLGLVLQALARHDEALIAYREIGGRL